MGVKNTLNQMSDFGKRSAAEHSSWDIMGINQNRVCSVEKQDSKFLIIGHSVYYFCFVYFLPAAYNRCGNPTSNSLVMNEATSSLW